MKIFVSYTLKDGYLDTSVLSQVKELYRNSDSCYIDILDNDSVDKQGRVEKELQSADVLLLIETPMVMESKWVRHELNVAKNRNILIIKSDINNIKKKYANSVKRLFTLSKLWGIFTYFLRFANNMQNIVF